MSQIEYLVEQRIVDVGGGESILHAARRTPRSRSSAARSAPPASAPSSAATQPSTLPVFSVQVVIALA
jgi:hypothetical protein